MSGPSEAAAEAALGVAHGSPLNACDAGSDTCETRPWVDNVLAVAHDPALGLDRSVCLREVWEWLDGHDELLAQLLQGRFTT